MADDTEFDDEGEITMTTSVSRLNLSEMYKKAKPFILEQVKGPGAWQRFVLRDHLHTVGRSEQADIRVQSSEVSRKHMVLKKTGNEYSCIDQNSRNGIYLNGVKIHSAILKDADMIQVGDVVFVYHEGT